MSCSGSDCGDDRRRASHLEVAFNLNRQAEGWIAITNLEALEWIGWFRRQRTAWLGLTKTSPSSATTGLGGKMTVEGPPDGVFFFLFSFFCRCLRFCSPLAKSSSFVTSLVHVRWGWKTNDLFGCPKLVIASLVYLILQIRPSPKEATNTSLCQVLQRARPVIPSERDRDT